MELFWNLSPLPKKRNQKQEKERKLPNFLKTIKPELESFNKQNQEKVHQKFQVFISESPHHIITSF